MTYDEVGKKLNLKKQTIRKYVREGKIKSIKLSSKVVRITQDALDTYLKQFEN